MSESKRKLFFVNNLDEKKDPRVVKREYQQKYQAALTLLNNERERSMDKKVSLRMTGGDAYMEVVNEEGGMNASQYPNGVFEGLLEEYVNLIDYKRQAEEADLRDRRSFLLFRTLTAVSIGMVILGISATAKFLDIPISLIRISG